MDKYLPTTDREFLIDLISPAGFRSLTKIVITKDTISFEDLSAYTNRGRKKIGQKCGQTSKRRY